MPLDPLPGFKSLETHHCITGSMKHIYEFNGHPLSEEMLLGIGGGIGFIYWHMKGSAPFIGGRGKGAPSQPFERCVGERTGVRIGEKTTSSAKQAEKSLFAMLADGQPAMVYLDMGFLPYFDFGGQEYHFGAHAVVICGIDQKQGMVLIADRDKTLHPVSLQDLANARGSTFKPFPPKNRWFTFDFKDKHTPNRADLLAALTEQVEGALSPPISNLGVPGIRKAAQGCLGWPEVLDEDTYRFTLFNTYIFISPEGGSGGGIFRYMFGRFLQEAAGITNIPELEKVAGEFKHIGDQWQEVAELFRLGWEAPIGSGLAEISSQMLQIADLEEAAWRHLDTAIR